MPKGMSETQVIASMCQWLKYFGHYFLRLNSGKVVQSYRMKNGKERKGVIHLCPVGTPDLMVIIQGIPVFIEVKKDEEEVRKWKGKVERYLKSGTVPKSNIREINQYEVSRTILSAGAKWFIISSVDELESIIKSYKVNPMYE